MGSSSAICLQKNMHYSSEALANHRRHPQARRFTDGVAMIGRGGRSFHHRDIVSSIVRDSFFQCLSPSGSCVFPRTYERVRLELDPDQVEKIGTLMCGTMAITDLEKDIQDKNTNYISL